MKSVLSRVACFALLLVPGMLPAAEPLSVGNRTCLFLDDRFVAEQSGLRRTWHQGQPRPEPAITVTERWEDNPHMFGSALYDPVSKLYKMWYETIFAGRGAVCYAESIDGRNWKKPQLGLVEIQGTKDNNCVLLKAELPNVFLDPNAADAGSRFKMFAWCNGAESDGKKFNGHVLFQSEDGIHWKGISSYGLSSPTDETSAARVVLDTNEVVWDPLGKRYLGTFRTFPLHPNLPGWFRDDKYKFTYGKGGHRRGVGVATSNELTRNWTRITTVLKADDKDDEKVRVQSAGPELDWAELYIMPVFTRGNHYLGLVSLLHFVDTKDTVAGSGDLQLTFSHDAMKWHRQPDRQTLVAPSPSKLVPVYAACNEPFDLGDEMWIYYTEATAAHPAAGHKSEIRAAVWRKDGFVSMDATERGVMTTPPLIFEGSQLEVNFNTTTEGSLRVGLLDEDGKPLQGFETDRCNVLKGNATSQVVTWGKATDVSALREKKVRLRFELQNGSLWSFRFGG